jgi:hypothetical protein
MNGSVLDAEAAPFQPSVKVLSHGLFLGIDPDDQ